MLATMLSGKQYCNRFREERLTHHGPGTSQPPHGMPLGNMWLYHMGAQRAERMMFTGDASPEPMMTAA